MSVIRMGDMVGDDGLKELITGKEIKNVLLYSRSADDYLTFVFTDGTSLEIRYDWIYGWELVDHKIELAES